MEFEKMSVDELNARKAQIGIECEEKDANVEALFEEARCINKELEKRVQQEEKRAELRKIVAGSNIPPVEEKDMEERNVVKTEKEIRNSPEYIEAFARFIKTEDDTECRSLLTSNVGGQLPVPDFIIDEIKTAWERDSIMSRVRNTSLKGNVKIRFELSATGAVIHTEGTGAPDEEVLTFGIVTMIPQSIKKWISISDEALDIGGEEFLRYIYAEVAYQIAKKCAEIVVTAIKNLPTTATATSVSANALTLAPAVDTFVRALAELTSEAGTPVAIMNRRTYADFKKVQYENNYGFDIFENTEIVFSDHLPAYSSASAGETYMEIGDMNAVMANRPNGGFRMKVNDVSRAKEDLVEFIGREYVGIGITADKRFVNVKKPTQANG